MNSISIITVVYNNANTIVDALRSVMVQQDIAIEYIIIDGSSTDGTLELIKDNINSSVTLISEPDQGIYDAMNKGIRLATGDIVGFLNSDDVYYNEGVLKQVLMAFATNEIIQIVYGDLVYVRKHNLSSIVRTWRSKPYDTFFFDKGYVPPHPAFFVKRGTLVDSGGFDLRYRLAADYELMFRLLKIEQRTSFYLPEIIVKMRLGGQTNQSLANILIGNKEIINVWSKHNLKIPLRFWSRRYFLKLEQYLLALSDRFGART